MTNEDISQETHLIEVRKSLVKYLIRIRYEAIEDERKSSSGFSVMLRDINGICLRVLANMPSQFLEFEGILREAFMAWPKFSGDIDYPVPSTTKGVSAKEMYLCTPNKWEGEYGQLRFELLEFCIGYLQYENLDS